MACGHIPLESWGAGNTEIKWNLDLDFRLNSGFKYCMRSFVYIPGVRLSSADFAEPSVGSNF